MKSWWCVGASSVDTRVWGARYYCKKNRINTNRNTINVCGIELMYSEYDKARIGFLRRQRSFSVLNSSFCWSVCPSNITFVTHFIFFCSNCSTFQTFEHGGDSGLVCNLETKQISLKFSFWQIYYPSWSNLSVSIQLCEISYFEIKENDLNKVLMWFK